MKQFESLVEGFSQALDKMAAICIVIMMVVVVANILLRAILGKPLLGTIDYVNILMALTISLGLAYCALKNAHIAVEFIIEKFSAKTQALIGVMINLTGLVFWAVTAWYMTAYARNIMDTNLVASTVSIPMYPFVYLAALGFLALSLVLVLKVTESVRMVMK